MNTKSIPLALLLTFCPAAVKCVAQPAATASPTANLALPESDAGVPGVGPIRHEEWFVKTWNERRATFSAHADLQHGALVFLGDSITQGWGEDFRNKFPDVKTANRGISGDTTRGLLIRLEQDVLSLDPSGIVLLIGTNDLDVDVTPADIAGNVELLLDAIAAANPTTPIILCQVMPSSATLKRPADKIQEINRRYAELARAYPQVTVLDLYTLFANSEGDAKPEEFPDLLHPNEVGYEKWRAALWPLLATLGYVDREADEFAVEEGFESLFNGRDLTGWGYRVTDQGEREFVANWKKDDPNMPPWPIVDEAVAFDGQPASADLRFRAINGRLVITTPVEGRKIQKLLTTRDFPDDFTLKLQFRATPNADSGVFLRGHQLQCRDYTLAGPYNELKNYRPQDWNELVVEVKDNVARCTCNGEVIEAAYELPDTGPIGIEADRGQMEYRRIRVRQ